MHSHTNPVLLAALASNPSWPASETAFLQRVAQLISVNKLTDALAATSDMPTPWLRNAHGVCLLRLGRICDAIATLRELVFEPSGFGIKRDATATFQANYAVALLLNDNADGFFAILRGIDDQKHPTVVRLQQEVRTWQASLTLGQRLRQLFGSGPRLTLAGPPGDL
jgi:hypothetical protein